MRLVRASALAVAAALLLPAALGAQNQDPDRSVAGGGISVEGWKGRVDARPARQGMTVDDSKFMKMGDDFHVVIGPAAVYWSPANTARGSYTVQATFKDAKVDPGHPHPGGLFIGGRNLESDEIQLVYCTVYGTGEFLVGQFDGSQVSTPAARQKHAAIRTAGADGSTSNDVAWRVTGDRAECLINGTVVAGFDKGQIVGTDGIFGLRFSHNMEMMISGFGLSRD